ncbi:peptidoglycan-binding domain-containing protein [Umezawaea beigongshangensis]|uniref:peptidoglycan-binding domain-containing protein n=1 Tax=Umezawaea beigongshangensis TaxID=2780383 RepID=UPI0018F1F873|nr:peptidoglycan-binding domain-containing protein [Umezawaea beigongshangensis]
MRTVVSALLLTGTALLGLAGQATAAPATTPETAQSKEVAAQAYRCGYYDGTVTFRRGDVGNAVREIQCLINIGYYTPELQVDGEFGTKVDAAVRWYQRCSGITVDGVVGPDTWYQLRNNPNC